MKSKTTLIEPEFSHPLSIEKIPAGGMDLALNANESERVALAKRFDLIDLPSFQAKLSVSSARAGEAVAVIGTMIADVVQACVVTLEPLPAHIEHKIDVLFAPPEVLDVAEQPALVGMDEDDVEPIIDGQIDLGELVAQHLGISLDPYPRKAGAAFPGAEFGGAKASTNPFVKLAELKKKHET